VHAIEPEQHARLQHLAQPVRGWPLRPGDRLQRHEQLANHAIDPCESDVFFAAEMKGDGAFRQARLGGELVDCHLLGPVPHEQVFSGIKDTFPNLGAIGGWPGHETNY
jgi:hypothetical protein